MKSPATGPAFRCGKGARSLRAILLDASRTQTSEAVLVNRVLPRQEFLDSQRVTRARFLEGQQAATYRCDHLRLSANDPTFGRRRRQVRDGQRTTIRPDHIF